MLRVLQDTYMFMKLKSIMQINGRTTNKTLRLLLVAFDPITHRVPDATRRDVHVS